MNPIKKFVVVGGGSSGWIAAAILANRMKPELCQIELVESDEIGTIGVGESTIPPFVGLLKVLGIDEQDFIASTHASFKLGIQFSDWKQKGEEYFHPFGSIGHAFDHYDFYQVWLKAKSLGSAQDLQDFTPAQVMAKHGRFFLSEKAQKTPIGESRHALHLDAKLAANYFRQYAEERGVVRTEGKVEQVLQADSGFIEQLVLTDGRKIKGDFFIDCTGFSALLIHKTLNVGYEDWSHYLPCDRAIAVQTASVDTTPPFTLATARSAGWTWRIPLQSRVGNGYVYSSKFCSDEEARTTLLGAVKGELLTEPRVIPFQTGVRHEIWKYNCLALGLAAGFVEPLESTAIHLVIRGMDFFLRYFPDCDCEPVLVAEYNRRMVAEYEEIRDFIVLHYCVTERQDSAFWRYCKNMELPRSLQERIELFKAHGTVREGIEDLFRMESWQSVFEGMGIRPKKYCPRIDNLNMDAVLPVMNNAVAMLDQLVQKLPTHDDFLATNCPVRI